MRLLAIGDIHGCSQALATLLERVGPRDDDRIVTLGDYVDRGPDSRGVLHRLITLNRTGRLVALRGNHDMMMLEALSRCHTPMWLACGGAQTLASYGIRSTDLASLPDHVPQSHWHFLEDVCVDWHETEKHFFVHANAYPDLPLNEQPLYMLHWEKLYEPCVHFSGKVMVCGHTPQRTGLPVNLGATICIDTGIYEPDGWLTCLDVLTGRYWQANQHGQWRIGWLDEGMREEED
jgi:serine/threonine protein phosphatase 1